MRVLHEARNLGTIVLGTFDGIHLGHRAVIERGVQLAQGHPLSLLTFSQHPQQIIRAQQIPPLLSHSQRIEILTNLGVDQLILLDFYQIQQLTSQQFIDFLVQAGTKHAVIGYDYTFGQGGKAGPEELGKAPFSVDVVEKLEIKGHVPSSSAIRSALAKGDLPFAQLLLGRPYSLTGTVARGAGRGRTFNLPTANIELDEPLFLPLAGVYLVWAQAPSFRRRLAVLNLGPCPTFEDKKESIEVFVPDWSGDLYGQKLTVDFIRYLRAQNKFAHPQALRAQVEMDLEALREEEAKWQEKEAP